MTIESFILESFFQETFKDNKRPKFNSLEDFFKRIIHEISKVLDKNNSNLDFRMLVQATIINFQKKETYLDIMIKRGSILVENCFMIVVYNQVDKRKISRLEGINKMRQIMVASISHELRTPLNSMMILLQCAKSYPNLSQTFYKQYIQPALDQSEYLLCLINDILDYTQLSLNHKPRFIFEPTNLQQLIKDVLSLMELRAKMRKIDIYAYIDPQIDANFVSDPRRIKQILINLVGNAMKFTFKGHIKIKAKQKIIDKIKYINITVKDTGVGIEQKSLKNLFKIFQKVERTKSINKSGIGLGLMISYQYSKFLNKEGGKGIQVISTVDVGSAFSFQLEDKQFELKEEENSLNCSEIDKIYSIKQIPIFECRISKKEINSSNLKMQRTIEKCKHPKILIVDDSEYNIYALMLLLKQFSYETDSANNGKTAVEMIISKEQDDSCGCYYEIILMDCNMPVMDGYAACREIKKLMSENKIHSTYVVACTADVTESNRLKCEDYQFDQLLSKPIKHNELKDIVKNQLKTR